MIVFVDGDVPCRINSRQATKNWLRDVVEAYGFRLGDLSIVSYTDDGLLEFNQAYLEHDTYTDIITFDYSEGKMLSGDLLISFERVKENAGNQSVMFDDELRRVMVHGVLHLIGFKDKSEDDAKAMRDAEDRALTMFHVEHRN